MKSDAPSLPKRLAEALGAELIAVSSEQPASVAPVVSSLRSIHEQSLLDLAWTILTRADGEACRALRQHMAALEARATDAQEPIPMILFCPRCGKQHIDEPQPEKGWDNPPHRSHECQFCQWTWRPTDVDTVGVAFIKTTGKRDSVASVELAAKLAHPDGDQSYEGPLRLAAIEEILAYCGRATRGPWKAFRKELEINETGRQEGFQERRTMSETVIGTAWDHPQLQGPAPVVTLGSTPYYEPQQHVIISEADAELIERGRMDLPLVCLALIECMTERDEALRDRAT